MKTKKRGGRSKGKENVGYFHRKGRGWSVTVGKSKILLRDENGKPLPEDASKAMVRAAAQRFQEAKERAENTSVTVGQLGDAFLSHYRHIVREKSLKAKAERVWDFCTGWPGSTWNKPERPIGMKRIHNGFKDIPVDDINLAHIDQWMEAHPGWSISGGQRMGAMALKRMFNWGVSRKLITKNPIYGMKVHQGNARLTYFDEKQEAALLAECSPALAMVMKILIRTGVRYGCEFCQLRDHHVEFTPRGMQWTFAAGESKTNKIRRVYVTDPEIIEHVKQSMADHGGHVFRDRFGKPWTLNKIRGQFEKAKRRCEKNGIEFDADACVYTTRHTYAKRILSGHWNGGKTCSIEHLAALMGNRPDQCRKYTAWCEAYTSPLWDHA